ncbi:BTB/POZ domain-containing protein kctd3 [Sorochytrium milnesiophthora]
MSSSSSSPSPSPSWLSSSPSPSSTPKPTPIDTNRVLLNLGGTRFEVSHDTLLWPKCKSNFFRPLLSGEHKMKIDEHDGSIYLDRSPRVFEVILQFLRTTKLSIPSTVTVEEVRQEAEFYGLYEALFPAGISKVAKHTFVETQDRCFLKTASMPTVEMGGSYYFRTTEFSEVPLLKRSFKCSATKYYRILQVKPGKIKLNTIVIMAKIQYGEIKSACSSEFTLIDFRSPPGGPKPRLPVDLSFRSPTGNTTCTWLLEVRVAAHVPVDNCQELSLEVELIHEFDDCHERIVEDEE